MPHFCYILYNDKNCQTYNGYTVNLEHRLRQHNCEIAGGAKYTTSRVKKDNIKWKILCYVTSNDEIFNKRKALSLEWHIRFPTCKKPRPHQYRGKEGRIEGLKLALKHPKFEGINFELVIPSNE